MYTYAGVFALRTSLCFCIACVYRSTCIIIFFNIFTPQFIHSTKGRCKIIMHVIVILFCTGKESTWPTCSMRSEVNRITLCRHCFMLYVSGQKTNHSHRKQCEVMATTSATTCYSTCVCSTCKPKLTECYSRSDLRHQLVRLLK